VTRPADHCAECGFDGETVSVGDSIAALRSFRRRWTAATALPADEPDDVLRRRPAPEVWSVLEYAAHTRDTIAANGWLMARALTEDDATVDWPTDDQLESRPPSIAPDTATAVDELAANSERVAARAERTDAGDWRRTIRLQGGMDELVDALWLLRHCVHEGVHHLRDVQRVLADVRRQR
jgi:hypothetical protein